MKTKRIVAWGIVALLAGLLSTRAVRGILVVLLFFDWSETSLPKQERFEREIVKIRGIQFWEMKNVYTTDEERSFFLVDDDEGECVFSRYYMVNKAAKDEEEMQSILEEFCERTPFVPNGREAALISGGRYKVTVKYKFYKKSKDLPAFWRANRETAAPDVIKWHDSLAEIAITDKGVPKEDVIRRERGTEHNTNRQGKMTRGRGAGAKCAIIMQMQGENNHEKERGGLVCLAFNQPHTCRNIQVLWSLDGGGKVCRI